MKRHTSTYSVGSVDLPWQQGGMDIEPLASVTTNPTPKQSLKNTGQMCRATKTSEKYEASYTQESLFSQEDSPASHSQSQCNPKEREKKMSVISGQKCCVLYKKQGPLGSLVRMLLGLSTWHSTKYALTWRVKVTKSNRSLFQLAALEPITRGIGSGLWPTVAASRWKNVNWKRVETGHRAWDTIENAVARTEYLGGGGKERDAFRDDPRVLRMANGIPNRVDRIKGVGNSIVPQVASEIIRCINQVMEDNK
jgi:hypothetical protein